MAKEYAVGYGKPPTVRQFQKGHSGNPQGRPKGSPNFKTDLQEELLEPLNVTEGGHTRVIPKQRAIVKRTVEQALKGQMRATELIFKWQMQYLDHGDSHDEPVPLSRDDQAILDQGLVQLALAKSKASQHGESS